MILTSLCVSSAIALAVVSGMIMIKDSIKSIGESALAVRMRNRYEEIKIGNTENIVPLEEVGIKVSKKRYSVCRGICVGLLALSGVYSKNSGLMVFSIFLIAATVPEEKIGKISTPFGICITALKKDYNKKIEKEIIDGISYIRNRIAATDNSSIRTDGLIEDLISYSDVLRPAYIRMLSLIRTNERSKAEKVFAETTGSKIARDYARILIQVDSRPPMEMYETLISYQKGIRESRITELKRHDETVSEMLYMPVILNLLLIFFNFMYTSYFLQQREMLQIIMQ